MILVSPRRFVADMALSKPFGSFVHRRTVRLITDPEMAIDSLKVVEGLPDFSGEICGIVPVYGGCAFDITLKSAEAASKLAANGFPYGDEIRALTLLGVKTVHVSVFVFVEHPDEDLLNILKVYGDRNVWPRDWGALPRFCHPLPFPLWQRNNCQLPRRRKLIRRRTLRQRTPPLRSFWRLKGMIVCPAQWKTCQRQPNGTPPPVNSDSEEETAKKPNRGRVLRRDSNILSPLRSARQEL